MKDKSTVSYELRIFAAASGLSIERARELIEQGERRRGQAPIARLLVTDKSPTPQEYSGPLEPDKTTVSQ